MRRSRAIAAGVAVLAATIAVGVASSPAAADAPVALIDDPCDLVSWISGGGVAVLTADITLDGTAACPDGLGHILSPTSLTIGEANWAEVDLNGLTLTLDAIRVFAGQEFVISNSAAADRLGQVIASSSFSAGIGTESGDAGTIVIEGSNVLVQATGGPGSPGIGGGQGGGGGLLLVQGGAMVSATGGAGAPGIGVAGTVQIDAGFVEANGTGGAPGIDAVALTTGGTLCVNGHLDDTSTCHVAAGPGATGGTGINAVSTTISGGTVIAFGGPSGGPGLAWSGDGGTPSVSVLGGTLTATASAFGYAGIQGMAVEVNGGNVAATGGPGYGGDGGAAIGSSVAVPEQAGSITIWGSVAPGSTVDDGVSGIGSYSAPISWPGPVYSSGQKVEYRVTGSTGVVGTISIARLPLSGESWSPLAIGASASTPAPGDAIALELAGFEPLEPIEVEIHSTPVHVGTVVSSMSGHASMSVTIPSALPPGAHTIVATGTLSGHVASFAITVGLPATGAEHAPIATLALLMVLAGIAACLPAAIRRRIPLRTEGPPR